MAQYKCLKHKNVGGAGLQYYGIFEANNMSAQDMRTRGMLPLEINDFMDSDGNVLPCEQGMLLAYDEAKGVVRKATSVNEKVMIHYSEYKLYDAKWSLKDFALWPQQGSVIQIVNYQTDSYGRVLFNDQNEPIKLTPDQEIQVHEDSTPFPRMLSCITNDTFTTNTVIYDAQGDFVAMDNSVIDEIKAAVENGEVFAVVATKDDTDVPERWYGYFKLIKGAVPPTATNVFKAVLVYDLPDGQPAIRFEVWN